MAFRLSTDLKNVLVNTMITTMAGTYGTAGTASLTIYTGTQPASADSDGTGSTIAVIENIGWSDDNPTTSGTAALADSYVGTSGEAGTAGWARLECINDAGTCRIDGDVGTSIANVFRINDTVIDGTAAVTLLSANIYTV